ncbi:DNA cytosine methyltransferase [Methanomethylophilus alvi]|uniref:DNA cytosine methyltransferase n=1 Tax=Methanomethylophilus alvi TaxID=1291540 RepID=UPI0037DD93E8
MKKSGPYTFGSLFAGIGGICLGFSQAGFTVKWANELDKFACETYRLNESRINPDLDISEGDIRDFHPPCAVDVLGGGFPCQPYSVAGKMGGLDDHRGRGRPMFEEIIRIAKEMRPKPRAIFLENVGNLKTFDDGKTYQFIKNSLRAAGYPCIIDAVLNSKDYSGIAQFRNRIYIVAFKKPDDCRSFRNIYGDGLEKRDMDERFAQIVTDGPVPLKYYYSKDDPNKCISIRYEEHFVPAVTEHGVFYQYRRTKMRRNQNGLCPALTASMGGGGHNVPIILDDYGIRKLTPRECLNVQGFPKWYEFPEDMADGHKYKQAGNSVSVPVIHSFADIIHHALEDADKSKQ